MIGVLIPGYAFPLLAAKPDVESEQISGLATGVAVRTLYPNGGHLPGPTVDLYTLQQVRSSSQWRVDVPACGVRVGERQWQLLSAEILGMAPAGIGLTAEVMEASQHATVCGVEVYRAPLDDYLQWIFP